MFRLSKFKRGLSPVITTIFLMAIIIAAIGVSLGIIIPRVDELNDQIDLETNSSNFLVLDANFREMMQNGLTSNLFYTMDLGDTGFFMGDISSNTNMKMKYQTTNPQGQVVEDVVITSTAQAPTNINETQTRLIIRQSLTENVLDTNSNQFLTGSGSQNIFYLNSIQRASGGWTILNQSRFDSSFVYTALSYRNLISISKVISNQNLDVEATVSIQRVQFNFIRDLNVSSNFVNLQAEYTGLTITSYDWMTINNAGMNDRRFYIEASTELIYGDENVLGLTNSEVPYSHEVPELGSLKVRIQFIDHVINILL